MVHNPTAAAASCAPPAGGVASFWLRKAMITLLHCSHSQTNTHLLSLKDSLLQTPSLSSQHKRSANSGDAASKGGNRNRDSSTTHSSSLSLSPSPPPAVAATAPSAQPTTPEGVARAFGEFFLQVSVVWVDFMCCALIEGSTHQAQSDHR